jgi:hypothetical protein
MRNRRPENLLQFTSEKTFPISVIANSHPAAERERLVRGGQCSIMQMATADDDSAESYRLFPELRPRR